MVSKNDDTGFVNYLSEGVAALTKAEELQLERSMRLGRIEAQAKRELEQEQKREAARTKSQAGWDGIASRREKDADFIGEKASSFADAAKKGFLIVAASAAVISLVGVAFGAGGAIGGAWVWLGTGLLGIVTHSAFGAVAGQVAAGIAAAGIGTYAWRGITGHTEGRQALKDKEMGIESVEQVKERLRAKAEGVAPKAQPSAGSTSEVSAAMTQLQQQLAELRAELEQEKRRNRVTSGNAPDANNDNPTNQVINIQTATASYPQGELAYHLEEAGEPVNGDAGKSYTLIGENSINFILESSNIPEARESTANEWDRTMYGENVPTSVIKAKVLSANAAFQRTTNSAEVTTYANIITGRDFAENRENVKVTDEQAERWATLAVLGEALSQTLPVCIQGGTKTPLFVGSTGIAILNSFQEICARNGWEATPETAQQAIDLYEELKGEKILYVETQQAMADARRNGR